MSLGLGIFLLVAGGILAFGVRDNFSAFDLSAIGYIMMAGGVLVIILYFALFSRARSTQHTTVVERRDPPPPAV